MKNFLFIFILGLNYTLVAQKETAKWFFGATAGLDFNSGSPVPLGGSQMSTMEGCTSISDANGNLLMYSDGLTVWNKNHAAMPNGNSLMGDPSSAQSGLIVPRPGNPNIYYIFTVAVEGSGLGIRYSEVDMTLNGGNGDVTSNKNIFLIGPSSEKLTAVQHANGQDIWVVTQTDGTNTYYAYLVTSAGVNMTPVISSSGTANSPNMGADGYIKFSPDGTKLANAHLNGQLLELFSFNASTGVISNPQTFNNYSSKTPYGVEFSPNNQFLYVSTEQGSELAQYDLNAGNISAIILSKVILSGQNQSPYALQLALDGKIYVSMYGPSSIGVIQNPDIQGTACNFNPSGVNLTPGSCNLGLPQFITSYFLNSAFTYADFCYGDSTHFTSQVNPAPDSLRWDFGVNGSTDTSTLANPAFLFPDTGKYIVTLYSWLNNIADTAIDTIHIYGKFLVPMADLPICNGGSVFFDATHANATYLWSDNSSNATLSVNNPGIYWVDVTMNGCTLRDSVLANLVTFNFSLGNDTTLCPNSSLTKSLNVTGAIYLWSTGSTAAAETFSQAGSYWVNVTVMGCVQTDSINISYFPDLLFIGRDTVLCFDSSSVVLQSNMASTAYLWNTGATSSSIVAHPDSIYILQMIDNNNCVLKDTAWVTHHTPKVFLGNDISACLGENFILSVDRPEFVEYIWNTGQKIPTISVVETGTYYVKIKDNNGCYADDSISFDFNGCSLFIPNSFTPDEDGLNSIFNAQGENIIEYSLQIFNRWGQKVFETTDLKVGWDGKFNGVKAELGIYSYKVEYRDAINLKHQKKTGLVTLIR